MLIPLFSKYRGESYATRGIPLADDPTPGKPTAYLGKAYGYIALAALATFVGHPSHFVPEATAEIPVETGSLVTPLGIPYKTHQWNNPVPPPEETAQIPVETGHLVVPIGIPYRDPTRIVTGIGGAAEQSNAPPSLVQFVPVPIHGYRYNRQFAGQIPPVPIVVLEADELSAGRRSVYTPIRPYFVSRSFTVPRVNEEIDELLPGRRSSYLPTTPYTGKTFVGTPIIPPDVVSIEDLEVPIHRREAYLPQYPYQGKSYNQFRIPGEIDELTGNRRSVYLPLRPYSGKAFTAKPPIDAIVTDAKAHAAQFIPVPIGKYKAPIHIQSGPVPVDVTAVDLDELVASRRYIEQRPTPPYLYYGLSEYSKPDEIDELESGRRARYIPPLPYRSHIRIQGVPPPILVEAPELHPSIRRVHLYRPPYLGKVYTYAQQPDEIDELIGGKRSIVVPTFVYNGKSYIVPPPVPAIIVVEADELANTRRLIYAPVFPYAPNRSRIIPPEVPEIIVVEAEELTIAKVRAQVPYPFYNWNLARFTAHNLALDDIPPVQLITGNAQRVLADQLIAPIRTPIHVRKLGEQLVVIFKDNVPWSRYFSDLSKDALKQVRLTVTLDFPPTAPQGYNDATITVIGAKPGDPVTIGVPPEAVLPNTSYFPFVSDIDEVTIRFTNSDPLLIQDPLEGEFTILLQRK